MCEINILFTWDFCLPHPATWNYSIGMKLKEEYVPAIIRTVMQPVCNSKAFISHHSGAHTTPHR